VLSALAVAAGMVATGVLSQQGPVAGQLPPQLTWAAPRPGAAAAAAGTHVGRSGHPSELAPGASGPGAAAHPRHPEIGQLTGKLRPRNAVPPPRLATPRLRLFGIAAGNRLHVVRRRPPAHVAGFSSSRSRVLADLESANRVVYANPDGTRTEMVYGQPVNYRLPDGSWARANMTLVPAGTAARPGVAPSAPAVSALVSPSPSLSPAAPPTRPASAAAGWRAEAAPQPEWFAGSAAAGSLVRVGLPGGSWAGFGIAGASPARGSASGNVVSYDGVLPSADVRYAAGVSGVTEDLVLTSRSAPARWVFPLSLSAGVRAVAGQGGVIDLVNASGRVLAYMPPGFMTDSDINPRSGDGAYSGGVGMRLSQLAGRPAVIMTLDRAWLDSPARRYPVTVDPSLEYATQQQGSAAGTTYVESGESGNNSTGPEIKAGTWNGGTNVAQSYLGFSGFAASGSPLQNVDVLGADLNVFNTWSYSCQNRRVAVYPVTQSWTPSGLTSWPGPSTNGTIGTAEFASGWAQPGQPSPCPARWWGIPFNAAGVSLVNGWTHGNTDNGLAIGASPTDSYGWKKFGSYNLPNGDPFMSITYITDAASYTLGSDRAAAQITPQNAGTIPVTVTNTGSTTWTAKTGYELWYTAKNSSGSSVTGLASPTALPSSASVGPGDSVTVNLNVAALPVGDYTLSVGMYTGGSSPVAFSQYDPPLEVGLVVANAVAAIPYAYPPSGYVSPTQQPELSIASDHSLGGSWQYAFTLTCSPLPLTECPSGTFASPRLTEPYWSVPASMALQWNEPYTWSVQVWDNSSLVATYGPVSIEAEVPQPLIMSRLGAGGGAVGGAVDPLSGQYTTSATDASVAVAGPPLSIVREYNSADPSLTGAFGAGWSSVADMNVTPDCPSDCSVVVTMADGQRVRFGYLTTTGSTISYVPPIGSPDELTGSTSGGWTMLAPAGLVYSFASSGVISQITNAEGLTQSFTSSAGEVTAITDTASGRALNLTWATPTGAKAAHVSQVSISPAVSGQSGTWTYSYAGDDLTQACSPQGCVSYSYGQSVSHYNMSVLDAAPRSYYPFDEPAGTAATDKVTANLGTTTGTYTNVALGTSGPLTGTTQTAATFNGTSSYATLAPNLIADSTDVSIGLWFKTTGSGVLFGYQADPMSVGGTTGNSASHVPALYVGTDGDLRGEFWTGQDAPITDTTKKVTDGNWHYAVLAAAGNTQTLYLDGVKVNTLAGNIDQQNNTVDVAGAGFWNSWPAASTNTSGFFNGSLADVAVYPSTLTAAEVAEQFAMHSTAFPELTQVTLPPPATGQPGPVSAQVSYNAATDRVSTYTDSNGGVWQLDPPVTTGVKATSESLGQATESVTINDPAGQQERYSFDLLNGGELTAYDRGAGSGIRLYSYDAAGFLDQVTDEGSSTGGGGDTVFFTNDVYGNVLSRTWDTSNGCLPNGACTTYYSYYEAPGDPVDPSDGDLTAVRDARSSGPTDDTYLTSYTYNNAGELTSATQPDTDQTTYTYSTANTTPAYSGTGNIPAGLLLSKTVQGMAPTNYEYYADGDLARVTSPTGLYTVYTYDGQGRMLTAQQCSDVFPCTDGTGGLVTSYTWNAVNQQLSVTAPPVTNPVTGLSHDLVSTYAYNNDGNVTSLTQSDATGGDPARTTKWAYDAYGHVASQTDPAGGTTLYDYDTCGYLAGETNADGDTNTYTYNTYGEVTSDTLYPAAQGSVPTATDGPTATAAPSAPSSQAAPNASCESDTAPGSAYPSSPASPGTLTAPGSGGTLVDSYAYYPDGLLASQTDAMGRTTGYTYNADQELTNVLTEDPNPASDTSDPDADTGRQTTYTYDNAGNPASEIVEGISGGQIETSTEAQFTFGYDAEDRLTSEVLDSSGLDRSLAYTYEPDGQAESQTVSGPGGSTVTNYAYDNAGDLLSQSVADGSAGNLVTKWTYDYLGQPTTMTDPDGNETKYSYDPAADLSTVSAPSTPVQTYTSQTAVQQSPVTTYGYDNFGDQTQVVDPDKNVTTAAYDADGRVTSVTQPSYTPPGSSTAITAVTKYGYDPMGNVTSVEDPRGNFVCSTYDALGDLTSQTYPAPACASAPNQWSWTYDAAGEMLTQTDPTGAVTDATWGYFGDEDTSTQEIRSTSDTAYNTTKYAYDYHGDPVSVTSPDGVITTNTYNPAGELASTSNAYGDTTSYAYNYLGEVASMINPDRTSQTNSYDQAGNLTGTVEYGSPPSGGGAAPELDSQSYSYDADGNETGATDGNGHTTTWTYNPAGQVTSQVTPVSSTASITVRYGYDAAGNQTEYTNGNGSTTSTWTTYNSWNLPESVIEPPTTAYPTAAEGTWTTSYNQDGLPATESEPGGVTITDGYDAADDLTSQTGTGADATSAPRSYTYDLDGRMLTAATSAGTDTFMYNDAGSLMSATGQSGASSFTYNGDQQPLSQTTAAGTTSYTYDSADRLASLADPVTGAKLTYGYTPDSQISGVSYGTGNDTQDYGYNGLHELTSDTLLSPSGTTAASEAYTWDGDGNLLTKATTGLNAAGSTTFGYDQANRMTSSTTGGSTINYGWDNDGNLVTENSLAMTYDARDQLTQASNSGTVDNTMTYTARGTMATDDSGYGNFSYTTDAYGQPYLVGVQDYTYDALGRLVTDNGAKSVHTLAYGGQTSQIASDGTNTYSYDPAGDLVGVGVSGGTTSQGELALTDSHSDLTGLYTAAATAMTASESYKPVGSVGGTTGTMPALGFQSDYTDSSSGLVAMGQRNFSAGYDTFTANDTFSGTPATNAISPNLYDYGASNPVTNTDPTGHDIPDGGGGIGCEDCVVASEVPPEAGSDVFDAAGRAVQKVGDWMAVGSGVVGLALLLGGDSSSSPGAGSAAAQTYNATFSPLPVDAYAIGSMISLWYAKEALAHGMYNDLSTPNPYNGAGTVPGGTYVPYPYGYAPPLPPPPPPPPADVYSGPDPQAAASIPHGMLHEATVAMPDPIDPWKGKSGDVIDEDNADAKIQDEGMQPRDVNQPTTAADDSAAGDTGQLTEQPSSQIGEPVTPDTATPAGAPSAESAAPEPQAPTPGEAEEPEPSKFQQRLKAGTINAVTNAASTFTDCMVHGSASGDSVGQCFEQSAAAAVVGFGTGLIPDPNATGLTKLLQNVRAGGVSGGATSLAANLFNGKGSFMSNLMHPQWGQAAASTVIGTAIPFAAGRQIPDNELGNDLLNAGLGEVTSVCDVSNSFTSLPAGVCPWNP
jgi:RHS repeat-associated protein